MEVEYIKSTLVVICYKKLLKFILQVTPLNEGELKV